MTLGAAFARNPIGLAAIALMVFSIMLLNNKFAEAAGLAIAKAAKNVSPQLAAAVRRALSCTHTTYLLFARSRAHVRYFRLCMYAREKEDRYDERE